LHLWLGGMFIPEAYITATRQYVAQANSWSLEELSLQVAVIRNDCPYLVSLLVNVMMCDVVKLLESLVYDGRWS